MSEAIALEPTAITPPETSQGPDEETWFRLGYLTAQRYAEARNVTVRRLRKERQARKGPPFIKKGHLILYPIAGIKADLDSLITLPVEGRGSRRKAAK